MVIIDEVFDEVVYEQKAKVDEGFDAKVGQQRVTIFLNLL